MKYFQAKRLIKLADFLETVKEKNFDIGSWKYESKCGTVACALGWAALMPSFKKNGLYFCKTTKEIVYRPDAKNFWSYYTTLAASREFFGLTLGEANGLFLPSGYRKPEDRRKVTAKEAAKKIRKLAISYYTQLSS